MISVGAEGGLRTTAKVDGWPINLIEQQQAVGEIIAAARQGDSFATFTLNLDHLVKLKHEPKFRAAYEAARFISADGAPVARIASRGGQTVQRVTGADLVVPLCMAAAIERVPVYLFGTTADALRSASMVLSSKTGNALDIVGTEAPAQGFDPESVEADRALDRIANAGTRLCFVALGAPKQEILAARAVRKGVPAGFICVGAGLDFLAGTQTRAPSLMQSCGMEWLWRLATNPRRLAGRYASCALLLAELELRSILPSSHGRQSR